MSAHTITFTVELDGPVWDSLDEGERIEWEDEITDAINELAYVSSVSHKN